MSIHDTMERTKLPLIVVIVVPILALLYVVLAADIPTPSPSGAARTQVAGTDPAQTSLPAASVALVDPSSLPTRVAAAQLVPFSFEIQNLSDHKVTYQYKVAVHWSTGEQDVVDVNTLSLAAGASSTIAEQLKFEVATETAEVYFLLPQTGQSLHFIVPRSQ